MPLQERPNVICCQPEPLEEQEREQEYNPSRSPIHPFTIKGAPTELCRKMRIVIAGIDELTQIFAVEARWLFSKRFGK